jgi:aspartyl-tRNA(Asn)/glutamyl-tRNA(Gln) amidotransferase subunit A
VGKRVMMGKEFPAADYFALGELRAAYIREVEGALAPFDAMIMPTVPCMAPTIAETEASDEDYFRWNFRIMRNTGLINFLDGCAVSVPCHVKGAPPVGLMVCGAAMSDRRTLAVAAAIEQALAAN